MSFFKKLQNLPESKRKTILWSVIVTLSLVFFIVWIKNASEALRLFPKDDFVENFRGPLKERIEGLPSFDMPSFEGLDVEIPEITEEEWELLEEELTEEELEEFKRFLEEMENQKQQ